MYWARYRAGRREREAPESEGARDHPGPRASHHRPRNGAQVASQQSPILRAAEKRVKQEVKRVNSKSGLDTRAIGDKR